MYENSYLLILFSVFRQLNVMDETYVINQVKEDACFVSLDFNADMITARGGRQENTILRDYVLPDFTTIKRGYVRSLEESNGKSTAGEQVGVSRCWSWNILRNPFFLNVFLHAAYSILKLEPNVLS